MLECLWVDLGMVDYGAALALQREMVGRRQKGDIPDLLLLVEHPHVITLGRNGRREHLLAGEEHLRRLGVDLYTTDRGGDITYHGPGQLVGYPILDLRYWKRDVVAYLRALEETLIGALSEFGITAGRASGMTGVWVESPSGSGPGKIAAIGVHISRWVTSHGFALNVTTDLTYFQHIIPCGLAGKPVTSMERLLGGEPWVLNDSGEGPDLVTAPSGRGSVTARQCTAFVSEPRPQGADLAAEQAISPKWLSTRQPPQIQEVILAVVRHFGQTFERQMSPVSVAEHLGREMLCPT